MHASAMECQVCLDKFNATDRRPKVVPCGHTYCLRCLKQLPEQLCPTDRKAFAEHPDNLVDNFQVLNIPERPTLWCCSCQKEATSKECQEWHTLCSMKKARTEKAAPLLERLKTATKDAALKVDTMTKVRDLVMDHTSRLEVVLGKLRNVDATLQKAIETDTEDLAEAMAGVEQALTESAKAKTCPAAKDGGGILRLKMTQSSKTWSADLNLQEAKVDQVFQTLDVLTEGQLSWKYAFGFGTAPSSNTTTAGFGAKIPSTTVTFAPSSGLVDLGSSSPASSKSTSSSLNGDKKSSKSAEGFKSTVVAASAPFGLPSSLFGSDSSMAVKNPVSKESIVFGVAAAPSFSAAAAPSFSAAAPTSFGAPAPMSFGAPAGTSIFGAEKPSTSSRVEGSSVQLRFNL